MGMIYFLTLFVILNEVKNLENILVNILMYVAEIFRLLGLRPKNDNGC